MDIAIVGDVSKSMRKRHRRQLVMVVHQLIDELGVSSDGNHFGLVTFSSEGTIVFNFKESKYYNKKTLKDEMETTIKQRPKRYGTRTDLAMDKAATELYTPGGGDRPIAKNIMLVFTDGKPYIAKWDKKPFIPFSKSTGELEVIQLPSICF